jgi:hypothetical protein
MISCGNGYLNPPWRAGRNVQGEVSDRLFHLAALALHSKGGLADLDREPVIAGQESLTNV